jgi:multidrug efflux pump subunit AcrA (membrane-fusion protein)
MPEISQSFADTVFKYSNLLLIVGTAIVLIATIGAIISSRIRERFSDERISKNEALTEKAKAQTALANESAAKANKGAAQSNLRTAEVEKQNTELRIKFSNRRVI